MRTGILNSFGFFQRISRFGAGSGTALRDVPPQSGADELKRRAGILRNKLKGAPVHVAQAQKPA